ncbi:MAG: phosphatidate cytidylyltransferase [Nitrospirae bacterium]|nr:phosphatidate cytidylyltransferase [Nitrospirota bacterium]
MHLQRLVVAAVALPLLYLYITKLSSVYFLLLLSLVSALGQAEFYSMYKTRKELAIWGIVSGLLLMSSLYLSRYSVIDMSGYSINGIFFMLSFVLMASARLFLIKEPSASLSDLAPAIIGFLYVPNLMSAQWYLRLQGAEWIIFLYGCVWASDSLAFYVGTNLGKRKLYPSVSPNKTVEGAVGSVAGGIIAALILGRLLLTKSPDASLAAMGAVIGLVTIAGDLVESMFKRDAGVKDSGSIVPGHGGILDKLDGSLYAGPALYWMTLVL